MSNWSAGYVADVGYTFGYYGVLNPLRVRLAFLSKGLVFPDIGNACELGFGQGMSTVLHATGSTTAWHGTDFNPAQAGFAQELASVAGTNARLYDEAFSEFSARTDLPDFDFIALHGIWSWVSEENRAVIVDFIRRKLKVGGVLYISYNTMPGWASFGPMRHLLTEHAQVIGTEGSGLVSRINDAVEFAEKLIATNPLFARINPSAAEKIRGLKGQSRHYLAHEFFNRDWHPMHFAEVADFLEVAKVSFACSANYLDNIDAINLTPEQQVFLKEIPDSKFRESVRDFMVNQQFRMDYWVKGARKLSSVDQTEAIRAEKIVLTKYRPDVSLKVKGALGEATMSEDVYGPYLDYLADHKIRTLAQIEQALSKHNVNLVKIIEATLVLSIAGDVAAVQEDHVIQKAKKHTEKLNAWLCSRARGSDDIAYLASPVTGGGIMVSRFSQIFLSAIALGHKQPEAWAELAWKILNAQGQRLLKEGKTLETDEENLAELKEHARIFSERQLPVLRALQIV